MKRYLRGCILFSLIFIVLLLTGCNGKKIEDPQLKIVVGNEEVPVIYYGNQHNQTGGSIETRLKKAMENNSWEELPYISLNEIITIKAQNFQTEEFAVFDYILAKNGTIRYDEKSVQTLVVPVNAGKATISLPSNLAVNFSSNSADYLPGKTIRCFVIRTDIEGSSFAFAFIFRTDAK